MSAPFRARLLGLALGLVLSAGAVWAEVREYRIDPVPSGPAIITVAPDGSLWFAAALAGEVMNYARDGTKRMGLTLGDGAFPVGIALDSRGRVWFTDADGNTINRLDPATGRHDVFPVPTEGAWPFFVVVDSLDRIWFTERGGDKIGRFDPATERFDEFALEGRGKQPAGMAITADDHVFFTQNSGHKIGHIAPGATEIREIAVPSTLRLDPHYGLAGIFAAPNGDIWFAELDGRLGQIPRDDGHYDRVIEYPVPNPAARPAGVYVDQDHCVWFTELDGNRIVRFDPASGSFEGFMIPTGAPDPEPRAPAERSARGHKVVAGDVPARTSRPFGIYGDAAGQIWFTEQYGQKLGVVDAEPIDCRVARPAFELGLEPSTAAADPPPTLALEAGAVVRWIGGAGENFTVEDREGGLALACTTECEHRFIVTGTREVTARVAGAKQAQWHFEVVNPKPAIVSHELPIPNSVPGVIEADNRGGVWFTLIGGFSLPGLAHLPPGEAIGRIDLTGQIELFRTPTPGSAPTSLKVADDGSVWFTERLADRIGVWEPLTRAIREIPLPVEDAELVGIAIDERRARVWFTARGLSQIGYVDRATDAVTLIDTPSKNSEPSTIAIDHEGAVWFDERGTDTLVRMDPESGAFELFEVPTAGSRVIGVTPDARRGRMWFLELATSKLGWLDLASGQITEVTLPSDQSFPFKLTVSLEGAVFLTEVFGNRIGLWDGVHFFEFDLPRERTLPGGIALDRRGNLWFTEQATNRITMIPIYEYRQLIEARHGDRR